MTDIPTPATVAVILCAGQGTRMRAAQNKVFLPVAGKPILLHAIEAFTRAAEVDELLLVAHPDEVAWVRSEVVARWGLRTVRDVIAGGATRHQSEQHALDALRPRIVAGEIGVVLIHDGARPFAEPAEIDELVRVARSTGGALLATAVPDDEVIARVDDDATVTALYPAAGLWRAQTPQAFEAGALLAAYDAARATGFDGTDTAATFEHAGHPVHIVPGQHRNFKVTTPSDLVRAEYVVRQPR
jgi:2-C-methyl-D-erythritol 4-phosphate cytidylyltransferase